MKIMDNINSLLGDDLKASIHPKAKLKGVESAIEFEHTPNSAIDPEDIIAWLVTQPNANGTLYLANVVRQYMHALRAAPAKLQIPVAFDVRSVFTCHTPDELHAYWDIFRTAPNYKQVNKSASGMFSAGMGCYMRYLQHLSDELNMEKPDVVQLIERHNLQHVDTRNSGGALWVIGGRELSSTMLKLRDSGFPFTFKLGGGRSSGYRDAWWYKSSGTVSRQKSEESEEAQPVYKKPKDITNSAQCVDFARPELCAQTRPLTCIIKGKAVVPSKQNWTQLLVAITEWFLAEGNPNLESLDSKSLYGSKTFFLPTKAEVGTCSLLSNGMWIYTNYNPQTVVRIIRNLCQNCGVNLDDIIITYKPKYGKPAQSVEKYTRPANVFPAAPPRTALDSKVIKKLTDVLSAHFGNGYRLNSPIELERFRSFAVEDFGEEIVLPHQELKRYISACGITYDNKVYAVSAETEERIKELVDKYFSDGARAIFFAEFYDKNENWLFGARVVSEGMLIDILRRLFPKLSFTQTYFGYTDASVFVALEGEILRVWADDVLLTYSQLAERLRYIPLERIKSVLGQTGDFIWSSVETFSHVSRIEITDEERKVIREAAVRECKACGYTSIIDLPLGEIVERNYQLSITAFHDAVYRLCLSDKFEKKGKIVSLKGDVFDALTIMKKYCRTIDKCSLDDLLTYEKELTGEVHRWIPMDAGNTILVRIDKNAYVADRYVHFNADTIDEAIGLFVKGDYLPLKSFTTFGVFPHCGQTWNLFLLESYCRRFSRKFRFDTPSVNSRNAGAVIRKSCGMDYTEIMTDAVAKADVPLKDTAVGKFLYENGYTGRSTTARANEIIDKAKAMRKRMN
ncbi:MAG: hypothetical protein WC647_01430 [Desulfomonilaceae bacterium]|jgi:hypothetical protein